MPIIINEIEINVQIASGHPQKNASTSDNASREAIIKECVEKVMEIINQKNER
ncbi:MAG: DUF5908 family protein [Anditalea sp.]